MVFQAGRGAGAVQKPQARHGPRQRLSSAVRRVRGIRRWCHSEFPSGSHHVHIPHTRMCSPKPILAHGRLSPSRLGAAWSTVCRSIFPVTGDPQVPGVGLGSRTWRMGVRLPQSSLPCQPGPRLSTVPGELADRGAPRSSVAPVSLQALQRLACLPKSPDCSRGPWGLLGLLFP